MPTGPDPPKDVGVTLDVLDTIRIQQASSVFTFLSRDARIATRKGTTRSVIATGRSPVLTKAQILDPRGMLPATVKNVLPPSLAALGLNDSSGFLGADFAPAAGVSTTQRHAVVGTRDGFLLLYDDDAETFTSLALGFANPGFSLNAVCFTWAGTTVIAGNSNGQIYSWGTDFTVAVALVSPLPAGTIIRDIAFLNGTTLFLLATNIGLFQFDHTNNLATLIFRGDFDRVAVDRLPPDVPSSSRAIVTEALSDEGGPVTPAFYVVDMQLGFVGADTVVSASSYQKRAYPDFGQEKTISVAFMPNVGQSSGLLGRNPSVAIPPNDGWFFTGLDGVLYSYSASRNEFYGPFAIQTRSDLAHARAFLDAFRDTLFVVGQGGAIAAINVDSLTGDGYMLSTGEAVAVRSQGPSEVEQTDPVKLSTRTTDKVERNEVILSADANAWFMQDAPWDDDPATFAQRGTTAVVASPTYSWTHRRSYLLHGVRVDVAKAPFDTPIVGIVRVTFFYDDGTSAVVVATQAGVGGKTRAYALVTKAVPVRDVFVEIDPLGADGATRWRLYDIEAIRADAVSATVSATVNIDNTPGTPVYTQDRGQVTNEEATVGLVNFSGPGTNVLDKDTTTEVDVIDPTLAAGITVDFTAGPLLIDRVGILPGAIGSLPTTVDIDVHDINGNVVTVFTRAGAGLTGGGIDSLNFEPILAESVVIDFGAPGAAMPYDVSEVVILKVHEVKAAANLNSVSTLHIDAEVVGAGAAIMPSGAAFVDPTGLAGSGIDVGKDQQGTVTVDVRITPNAAAVLFTGFIDWYFSPDNGATYHYGGSNALNDAFVAGNPTGFTALTEDSWQTFPKPERIFNRFIAIVVRNTGALAFSVTATINRQR